MTKTLTEQWREGTLTGGFYYIQLKDERWPLIDHTDYNLLSHKIEWKDFDWRAVEEVIEEVPCYEEYKDLYDSNKQLMSHIKTCEQQIERLQEQLAIATKALKEYANCKPTEWMSCVTADKALKEMEGVK